jgi:uncharacterized protein (TIGR02679 family)
MAEYHFVSIWQIQAPIERVWEEIYHAERWPSWWNHVVGVDELEPGAADRVGKHLRLLFRTRLPYTMAHRGGPAGHAVLRTLQQLVELEVIVRPLLVYVCENPAVLRRAAAELGAGSAPLVCTEGQPSTAFHHLAVALKRGGGELRYHGDFDWPGVAIAGSVMRRHGARPWRMSAADCIAGVRADVDYARLTGTPQPTPWDPELGEVMTATGRALYEESVADALIADLPGHGLAH